MEIRTKTGTVITITEAEMPVSVSGALTNDVDVVDLRRAARALKTACVAAEDCRVCAFGLDNGSICKLHSIPEDWEVEE